MKLKKTIIALSAVAALIAAIMFSTLTLAQETTEATQETVEQSQSSEPVKNQDKLLVLPPLVTAFVDKDKFYGPSADLSRALQQFFTFSLTVMTPLDVSRASDADLMKNFPPQKIYANAAGTTLKDKVDIEQLAAAAEMYNAQYVLCMENSKDAVLVDKHSANWTMSIEMKYVVYNAVDGTVSDEKSYFQEETYHFDSKEDTKIAKKGFLITFSGRAVPPSELAGNPMLFGGTIGGYPFAPIARKIAYDVSYF